MKNNCVEVILCEDNDNVDHLCVTFDSKITWSCVDHVLRFKICKEDVIEMKDKILNTHKVSKLNKRQRKKLNSLRAKNISENLKIQQVYNISIDGECKKNEEEIDVNTYGY